VLHFKRVHESGTEALITEHEKSWSIQINFKEANQAPATIAFYLILTIERAKKLANKEVSSRGHICNGSCPDWVEFWTQEPLST
jgi:hypothetical protein